MVSAPIASASAGTPGPPPRQTRVRWILALTVLAPLTFAMSLDRSTMALVAPVMQQDLHLSLPQMSIILTAFGWSYGLCLIPGGVVVTKLGPRVSLTLAALWWSAITFITPFAGAFLALVSLRILLGCGQALDWPASVSWLRRWFPAGEQARANSILLLALYLSHAASAPLLGWLTDRLSWHTAFHFAAAVGLVTAVLWYWKMRNRPDEYRGISIDELKYIESTKTQEERNKREPFQWGVLANMLHGTQAWALGVQYCCVVVCQSFFTTWLPTYLVRVRGLSMTQMGFAVSAPWITMMVSIAAWSYCSDRFFNNWTVRRRIAQLGLIAAAVAVLLAMEVPSLGNAMALLSFGMMSLAAVQVQVWLSVQQIGRRYTATLAGWTNAWATLLGGMFGPILLGVLVADTHSWKVAVVPAIVLSVVGAISWTFIHPENSVVYGGAV